MVGPRGRSAWLRDRVAASDPGLNRLRTAASGAFAMATAIGVEAVFVAVLGVGPAGSLVAMLLGAVVAMMGAMALTGSQVWPKVRTAAFFPVAIGSGLAAGVAVSGHTRLSLVLFVALMFVAVFIRRFGVDYFFYGFMLWIGYFFASLLQATVGMLPLLLGATVVASAWVLLLSATVMRTHPRRTLARVRRAWGARARALSAACADMLEGDPDEMGRRRRRVHREQARLAETALMIEAWSAEPGALPEAMSPSSLRRRMLDLQMALDRLAVAAEHLVDGDLVLRPRAARVCRLLARRGYAGVQSAAKDLHLAAERREQADERVRLASRQLSRAAYDFVTVHRSGVSETTPDRPDEEGFEPAVSLALGNLPGTPAVARDVAPRGWRWNPLRRVDFTTRQAVQVTVAGALAVVLGRELDSTRYYWAVITAFIAFTGTGTRSEAFVKAFNRVLGTVLGLGAGIWLAGLTEGNNGWALVVIVASMFLGFYLMRVSYAYMIFFVTIMVAQLYGILHQFSDALLMLRLEETAVGALVGIAVALLVTPLSTHDAVGTTQSNLLISLAELLDSAAHEPDVDLDALVSVLEHRQHQLGQMVAPLSHPLVRDASPSATRHRITLYRACVQSARGLAILLRDPTSRRDPVLAACEPLSAVARTMAEHPGPPGGRLHDYGESLTLELARADELLFSDADTPESDPSEALRRTLVHLRELLHELARGDHSPRGEADTGAEASRTPR